MKLISGAGMACDSGRGGGGGGGGGCFLCAFRFWLWVLGAALLTFSVGIFVTIFVCVFSYFRAFHLGCFLTLGAKHRAAHFFRRACYESDSVHVFSSFRIILCCSFLALFFEKKMLLFSFPSGFDCVHKCRFCHERDAFIF